MSMILLLGLLPLVLELVLVVVVPFGHSMKKCPALPHLKHVLKFLLMFTRFSCSLSNLLVSNAISSSPSTLNSLSGIDIKEDKENIQVDGLVLAFHFEPPMRARL
jgi:hypothetical protein